MVAQVKIYTVNWENMHGYNSRDYSQIESAVAMAKKIQHKPSTKFVEVVDNLTGKRLFYHRRRY